ncbi:MAG TPA: hypothetical protein VEI50_14525 [Nitrospiraceae bacterium]|nr:hypothetical protein [Nitrospiraceae bacterium]
MHCSAPLSRSALATLIFLAGCASPILQLSEQSGFYEKVKGNTELAKQFLRCSRQGYQDQTAESVSATPSVAVSGQAPSAAPALPAVEAAVADSPQLKADEDISALLDLIRDMNDPAERKVDIGRLIRIAEMGKRLHARFRIDEDRLAQDNSLFAQLLLAYNKAYFGDIQFRTQPTQTGSGIQGVFKVVSAGFVDCNGNAFTFPGLSSEITVSMDPVKQEPTVRFHASSVDSRRVASDLVRIFLEALMDAAFRVPATQEATALKVKWSRDERPYPRIDPDHPPISYDQFARVARDAMLAEAIVTSAVGKAVRGAGVFGTNNETLAAAVETAGGVLAKKLAEHEAFCYFRVTKGKPQVMDHTDTRTEAPAGPAATR